jgi:hypothetical protein
MHTYSIFGHRLRSEIAFPDLRAIEGCAAQWTLRISHQRPGLIDPQLLGSEDIGDGTDVRLWVLVYRLDFPRDFERIDAVVAQLTEWHRRAARVEAVTA